MNKQIHIALIENDIGVNARDLAEVIYQKGYRKERHGKWILDDNYKGKTKVIHRCSLCDRWVTSKKWHGGTLSHPPYCPWCGARMAAPEEEQI